MGAGWAVSAEGWDAGDGIEARSGWELEGHGGTGAWQLKSTASSPRLCIKTPV